MKNSTIKRAGFTLVEILVVIGIIAILAAVVLVALNPARQFAQARNSQRTQNVSAILNAVTQNMADNQGLFNFDDPNCPPTEFPTTPTFIANTFTTSTDLRGCLVPTYMSELPVDPKDGFIGATYNTGYTIIQDAVSGRITISAPSTELLVPATSTDYISATN